MPNLWEDLKFSLRSLSRRPGFTITAILVIAIGAGATTAIFSVVNGVLLTWSPLGWTRRAAPPT
jgi:hypothetical protein